MLCKVCECGEILYFEKVYLCQDPCQKCGRITQSYSTYSADDPLVKMLSEKYKSIIRDENKMHYEKREMYESTVNYYLVSVRKGYEIIIPQDGGVIGRTEIGAENLADNPAISKKHIIVVINKRLGMFIEDISRFGTSINGRRILKGNKVHVNVDDEIMLYNEKFIVKVR